jgi:hypothetical protein
MSVQKLGTSATTTGISETTLQLQRFADLVGREG